MIMQIPVENALKHGWPESVSLKSLRTRLLDIKWYTG